MSHVPHELAAEFPDLKDRIHTLKTTNNHFQRLFDDYHDVNREIHRAEAAGRQERKQARRGRQSARHVEPNRLDHHPDREQDEDAGGDQIHGR